MNTETSHGESPRTNSGAVLVGLILTFVGLALLADQTGFSAIHFTGKLWPFVMIAFGVSRFLAPPTREGRRPSRWTGIWFIYLGLWFFVNEFRVLGFWYTTSWPLLIVGTGIGMIWRAIEGSDGDSCQRIEGEP